MACRRTEGSCPQRGLTTGPGVTRGALRTGEPDVTRLGVGPACRRGLDGRRMFGAALVPGGEIRLVRRKHCRAGRLALASLGGRGCVTEANHEPDILDLHRGRWGRACRPRGLVSRLGQGGHHHSRHGQGQGPTGTEAVHPEDVERPGEPAEQHEDPELQDDECQRRAGPQESQLAPAKASPMARGADTARHGVCRPGGARHHALSPHTGRRQGCKRAHFRAVEYAGWLVPAPVGRLVCASPGWPVGAPVERLGLPVGWLVGAPVGWSVVGWPGWVTAAQ